MSFLKETRKTKKRQKKSTVQFLPVPEGAKKKKKKERDPPVGRTKGNSCKESTRHPNIRRIHRHKVSGAHEVARCDCHVHAATGLHPPPRRDAISAIFTRKASRPIPAARSSNKACYTPATPTAYARASLLARTRVVVYSFETALGMAGDPEKSFHIAIPLISRGSSRT